MARKAPDHAGLRWWGGSGSNRRLPDYESSMTRDKGVLTLPGMDCFPRGITHPQDRSGHARTVPNCLRTWSPLAKTLAKKPERPPRECGATAPLLAPGTLPRGGPGSLAYFLARNVYLPSSSDSLSSQITVHLPSPLNLAFTAPFFVSYTAHTSSLFSETDHS